jgi:hypothetical protein
MSTGMCDSETARNGQGSDLCRGLPIKHDGRLAGSSGDDGNGKT